MQLIAFIVAREKKQPSDKKKHSMAVLAEAIKNKPVVLGKCGMCVEKLEHYMQQQEEAAADANT